MRARPGEPSRFPDPRRAPADGPLAWGGDLEPATLLDAYRHGIFPWPVRGELFWWSPDPRAVIPLDGLRVSRSLRRTLRSGRLECTVDTAFDAVVRGCADRPGEGTWITPGLRVAYRRLHRLGLAHSVEVWAQGTLAGGLYGVALGGAFIGESMFHRVTDASKVALCRLVERLRARGFRLLDAQMPTDHLQRLGAVTVPRATYLAQLDRALALPVTFTDPGTR